MHAFNTAAGEKINADKHLWLHSTAGSRRL
jgi:hypothetical protein